MLCAGFGLGTIRVIDPTLHIRLRNTTFKPDLVSLAKPMSSLLMDKTPAPCSVPAVPGLFSALPTDVLLDIVPYTDISSAIKMTLVSNFFFRIRSRVLMRTTVHRDITTCCASRFPNITTCCKSVTLSGYYCSITSSIFDPFLGSRQAVPWTTYAGR